MTSSISMCSVPLSHLFSLETAPVSDPVFCVFVESHLQNSISLSPISPCSPPSYRIVYFQCTVSETVGHSLHHSSMIPPRPRVSLPPPSYTPHTLLCRCSIGLSVTLPCLPRGESVYLYIKSSPPFVSSHPPGLLCFFPLAPPWACIRLKPTTVSCIEAQSFSYPFTFYSFVR